jgi:hypothetical protein
MFNGIEIPGIQFLNQLMNDETVQYNNKFDNDRITKLVAANMTRPSALLEIYFSQVVCNQDLSIRLQQFVFGDIYRVT